MTISESNGRRQPLSTDEIRERMTKERKRIAGLPPIGSRAISKIIVAVDFRGGIPTKEEIIAKFPPQEETFTVLDKEKKENIAFSRMVSRSSNSTIIYSIPPKAA